MTELLQEINDRLLEWNKPSGFTYEAKLYVDQKRNTATAYVTINGGYEIRLGFKDPFKQNLDTDELCYNVTAILRETNQPVADMDAVLYCPVESHTEQWQLDIEYDNKTSDTIFLHPTGKSNELVATTDVVNILELIQEKDQRQDTSVLRQMLENSVRSN